MDENQKNQNQDVDLDNNDDSTLESVVEAIEDVDTKKHLQTEIARKKHFREKYNKEAEARQRLEKELAELKGSKAQPSQSSQASSQASSDDIETVLSLRSEGYSDAEILNLRKYAKRMNSSISEIKDDPFIKSGIEAERQKRKVEQATIAPSKRGNTTFKKDWSQMSEKERRENFQPFTQSFKK